MSELSSQEVAEVAFAPLEQCFSDIGKANGNAAKDFAIFVSNIFSQTDLFRHVLDTARSCSSMSERDYASELHSYLEFNAYTTRDYGEALGISSELRHSILIQVGTIHTRAIGVLNRNGAELH